MPATAVIDTGDPLPDTFTFTATLGTSPYTYSIDITGIENSGITFVISGGENNVVNFDATNARGGEYVINLEGTVLDTPGQRDVDVDNYFVTVNPIIAAWAPGSLSIPSLDQGATSAESATLTVSSGGAAPYTYHLSWLAGQAPVAGMTIEQLDEDDNEIEITIDGTVQAGTYQGTIIAEVGDATGQKQVVDSLAVSVTVDGMVDWTYDPALITALTDEETQTSSSTSTLGPGTGGVAPYTYSHGFFSSPEPGLVLAASGGDGEIVQVNVAVGVDVGTHTGTIRGRVTDAAANFVEDLLNYSVEVTEVAQLVATDGVQWDGLMASSLVSTGTEVNVTQLASYHTPRGGSFHVLQLTMAGGRSLAAHVSDVTLDGTSLEGGNEYADYLMYTKVGSWGATSMTGFLFMVRDTDPAFAGSDPRGPWVWEVSFAGGFNGTAVVRSSSGNGFPSDGTPVSAVDVFSTGSGSPTQMDHFANSPTRWYIDIGGSPGVVGGDLLAGYAIHMDGIEQVITSNKPNMLIPTDQSFEEINLSSLRPVNILSRKLNLYRSGRSVDVALEEGSPATGPSIIYEGGLTADSHNGAWTATIIPPLLVADNTWTPLMRALVPNFWWRFGEDAGDDIIDVGTEGIDLIEGFTQDDPSDDHFPGVDVVWEGLSGAFNFHDGVGRFRMTDPISAANTGTVVFVFRHPPDAAPTNAQGFSPMWAYHRQGNAGESITLNMEGLGGLNWRTLNNTSDVAANNFVRTYDMTDLDEASGFHLAALVKHNDGEPPDLFVDGGLITSWSDVEGGSSDKGMWWADVASNPSFTVKASGSDGVGWDGVCDEVVAFQTRELTQLEIQELTLGLGLSLRGDG